MNGPINILEQRRLALQARLDGERTQAQRNRLGQFATPTALAEDILSYAATLLPGDAVIHFLDPAVGTGSFYSALRKVFPATRIGEGVGFEIDRHYGKPAAELWAELGLDLRLADFTLAEPSSRFNLIICNPPYVRHHHLDNGDKSRLQMRTQKTSGMKLSGLAGLYCHFIGLSQGWMAEGGVAGCLIPSEFMDVNYGRAVKRYLLDRVTLLRVHRFDPMDVQFADALVSSAIVWFRNLPPPEDHTVEFTFGGTLCEPKLARVICARALGEEPKWTRFPSAGVRRQSESPTISDYFQIKRGIATGNNGFFILTDAEIASRGLPLEAFSPILPSPRYLSADEIPADPDGNPQIERRRYLLNTRLSEDAIQRRFPRLHAYLEEGKERGLREGYLCRHRTP